MSQDKTPNTLTVWRGLCSDMDLVYARFGYPRHNQIISNLALLLYVLFHRSSVAACREQMRNLTLSMGTPWTDMVSTDYPLVNTVGFVVKVLFLFWVMQLVVWGFLTGPRLWLHMILLLGVGYSAIIVWDNVQRWVTRYLNCQNGACLIATLMRDH